MMLHQGVAVYEVRNRLGYGMRWTLELQRDSQGSGDMSKVDAEGDVNEQENRCQGRSGTPDQAAIRSEHSAGESEGVLEGWSIKKTTFRGFLEPIAEMDHELELET